MPRDSSDRSVHCVGKCMQGSGFELLSFNYTSLCFILYLARCTPVFSACERGERNHTAVSGLEPLLPILHGLQSTCIALKLAISSCTRLEGSKICCGVCEGSQASFSFLTPYWYFAGGYAIDLRKEFVVRVCPMAFPRNSSGSSGHPWVGDPSQLEFPIKLNASLI